MERTFLMVKPRAVGEAKTGLILAAVEEAGFRIVGLASRKMNAAEAERFYDVHVGKPFFEDLVRFITSDMTVGVMLERDDAVRKLREVVGATDPAKAAPGTIRARFGSSLTQNAVHASDSPERVEYESSVFFGDCERAIV
ncbi:MAG: nucleoside-diphosphate kinase [Candidatus Eisenbacteria bacterium]|nr:nucleoside-diphosphate kinase [Candidatus Eisenbacteria bacterium]